MPPIASIIILTYNNLEYTRQCLESIERHTPDAAYELILVDNASQDDTPQFLEKYARTHAQVKILLNSANQGFARGNNQGAALAEGEYIVFLNNDIVVTPGWLPGLIRHLQDPQVGMVGPVTNASGNETRILTDYGDMAAMEGFAREYTRIHAGQAFEIRMLPFQCVALRRPVFEALGPLDERYGVGMFEDDDYAIRLRQSGYKIICAEDVFVHHWGSASFAKLSKAEYWNIYQQNLQKFEDKWQQTWQPHVPRPEFTSWYLRHLMNSCIELAASLTAERRETARLQAELNQRDFELNLIHSSRSWRLLQTLGRWRKSILNR